MSTTSPPTSGSPAPPTTGGTILHPFKAPPKSKSDWLAPAILTVKTITAAAECAPFPYIKGVSGTVLILLETVVTVKKNREDLEELCTSSTEIITILHDQIKAHGNTAAVKFKALCEELESYLEAAILAIRNLQDQSKGLRGRVKEFLKSSSLTDKIVGYQTQIQGVCSKLKLMAIVETNFKVDEEEMVSYDDDSDPPNLKDTTDLPLDAESASALTDKTELDAVDKGVSKDSTHSLLDPVLDQAENAAITESHTPASDRRATDQKLASHSQLEEPKEKMKHALKDPPASAHKSPDPDAMDVDVPVLSPLFSTALMPVNRKFKTQDLDTPAHKRRDLKADPDLATSITGMFRVLDLISESGSGGLVDKIIIAQESLKELINVLSPGAYASLTKVDFNALDKLAVKPLGLYGSKTEIIVFLSNRGVISDATSRALNRSTNDISVPHLRSGLYVLRGSDAGPGCQQIFVIYWPEPTTWNDDAISSVRRNRVTFMRYLTKISDQLLCLISPEHARTIVWNEEAQELPMVVDEGSGRLFTFKVAKTNEQDENVSARPGFTMHKPIISVEKPHVECSVNAAELQPILIHGETSQAILTKRFVPGNLIERKISGEPVNAVQLRSLLAKGSIRLTPTLTDTAIEILMDHGLASHFPAPFEAWRSRNQAARESIDAAARKEEHKMKQKLTDDSPQMEPMLHEAVVDKVLLAYPTIQRTVLSSSSEENVEILRARFASLVVHHPRLKEELDKLISGTGGGSKSLGLSAKFKLLKEHLISIDILFNHIPNLKGPDREDLIQRVSKSGLDGLNRALKVKDSPESKGFFSRFSSAQPQKLRGEVRERLSNTTDPEFLALLDEMLSKEPLLQPLITCAVEEANNHLQGTVKTLVAHFVGRSVLLQHETLKAQLLRKSQGEQEEQRKKSILQLVEEYESGITPDSRTLVIVGIEQCKQGSNGNATFTVKGSDKSQTKPAIECKLHVLRLTTDDKHTLQMDATFVPSPDIQASSAQVFNIPLGHRILHAQLLEGGKLLVIIEDPHLLYIYLDTPSALYHAIARGRDSANRTLHRDKIGKDAIIAYDEQKRMLSVCAASKLSLHIFVFDETFNSLQARGSSLDLKPWYVTGTSVVQSCFVCGCEEILFVDTSGQARIFSLITQQFRPASLSFEKLPFGLHSSPDGACLVLSFRDGEQSSFRAYHWSTFGSSQGIDLDPFDLPNAPTILTSFVNRRNVHLVAIDIDAHVCRSVVLDITKKTSEFMFKETGVKSVAKSTTKITSNNSLIDCFADVWTRFPVVAAVQRRTIVPSVARKPRKLVFVTDRDHDKFAPHFSDLIYAFEQRTRKPTGDVLKSMQVSAVPSSPSFPGTLSNNPSELSQFRAGEWLVDLLCLIPIQIAVTRENRFLPLKDGVTSAALERSLLGADVGQIVDALSLGWYESVFQSYMTSKPVKVVSSMGEQSVGKSFSLNHLVDTSFAGSAMRTTEGVWMSVTPTDEALIVALDFEGVHSIERSAQEDTLLVLFNTAISNLVLFRNNFALSRDITGLFHSFQSSSTILDPASNPTLFKSTLTIIIKDVVESDKNEIVREFSTKFQKIVEEEQDANFISRLHAGQLNIVPWPVIESRQFYSLFHGMARLLDEQEITHNTAGEFLHTLKTLMAKLKANDWGSISQTLVGHRAQKLLGGLSNALTFGLFEVEPDAEPLKNFDTDKLIEKEDTAAQFFLSTPDSSATRREAMLMALENSFDQFGHRSSTVDAEWFKKLSAYLERLAELRIQHVHAWISSNLSRFTTTHANMEVLRRMFETTIVDLRANVEVCGTQCAKCQLHCLLSRRHDSEIPHDCRTSHNCAHSCDFGEDHPGTEKDCGQPAGHAGPHICAVDIHLCGEPCELNDKQGCLGGCMKNVGHSEGGHMCSARLHKCGQPCDLKNLRVARKPYSCSKTCVIPSDEVHTQHVCDASACSLPCELCERLCSDTDHLHGLDTDAVHLCGQSHNCKATCQALGTCEIETAPQSIEATFTGRHETFQYTKYSQVAKRLPCVILIPPGDKTHPGAHSHSTAPNPFHFCETRCESCGYFCTLPRGHSQQEHETHHGSMSKTRWAVDGPDGTILELNGRKFGKDDDGAPMLCNLVCKELGRHAHLDYCRADDAAACGGPEIEHIKTRLTPNPNRAKDWISHSLFWRRTGFKDPYSRPDQVNFSKCDAMCPDTEHLGTATNPPRPSYCTCPLFHAPAKVARGLGYVSNDGHVFNCKNPAVMQQAFHVIFVIDRSGSMGSTDRRPLQNAPGTPLIARSSNNRLGAVYSALHGFWMSRNTALNNGGRAAAVPARRDAYSVVLFDDGASVPIANDFTSTPDDLLYQLLAYGTGSGTDFTLALTTARQLMRDHWSTERTPVVIFLSDGECSVADETVRGLSRSAVRRGKPLSFHAVSFGRASQSAVLRRMAQIALEVQTNAPRDPLTPPEAIINSSYSDALDTVRLAETFLGFAESLRKPRGALFSA